MNGTQLHHLLDQIQRSGSLTGQQREQLLQGTDSPWWLSVLLGLAAWIASLFLIASLFGPWMLLIEGPIGMGLAGVIMLVGGLWLFRRPNVFRDQMGLAFALSGQGLLVFAAAELTDLGDGSRPAALVCLLLSAGLLLVSAPMLYRRLCALLLLGSVAFLLDNGPALAVYGLMLACAATTAWLTRDRWALSGHALRLRALTDAATLMALLLALFGHQGQLDGWINVTTHYLATPIASLWLMLLIYAGPALLLLLTIAWLLIKAPLMTRVAALIAAGVLVLLTYQAPGLLISCSLGLAAFRASSRTWCLLIPAFALFYLGAFYYSLHISLLHKSLLLCASGIVLLAIRYGVRKTLWRWA